MKKGKAAVILVVILAFLGLMGWYSTQIISDTKTKQAATANGEDTSDKDYQNIKLGLDLSGGVSITYQIKNDNPSDTDVSDTIAKLEQRVESYTTEYSVYKAGDDRITVEIPGVDDPNEVLTALGTPGSLYFIMQYDDDGNANYQLDTTAGDYVLNYDIQDLIDNGSVVISGNDVKTAEAGYQTTGSTNSQKPVVQLKLNDKAVDKWAEATTKAAENGWTIGVYYDGKFLSVPTVNEAIENGDCVIQGMEYDKAQEIATFIRVGAINLELEELESNVVGAQLGGEALTDSVKAAIIGIIIVMVFMIVMYGINGVVASIALALYTTLTVAFLYWFEITLTLPGIAGIILGIGMAVDANVIVFSRIREEIATGKNVLASINEGYKKSFSAILDGQITTFLAALVLWALGSGTVKGFAYTLMISIILSLFTALVISRILAKSFYALGCRSEKLYGRAKERRVINFMKHRVLCFVISAVVILAGIGGIIGYAAAGKGGLNFSLEFAGGASTTAVLDKEYTTTEAETEIVPEVESYLNDKSIQVTTVKGTNQITLKTRDLTLEEREGLSNLLVEKFNADPDSIQAQNITSTISSEMRRDAVVAVVVACIFMLLYIWFRFKDIRFASSAIMALVHDVLVVLAAYSLLRISVGSTFIACMLTIVGYSVNDTIVIFDRIRENLRGVTKQTPEALAEVANKSLTQTLSRSINTSLTTFVMVLLLFILGVSSIKEFALPLMVGVISGTYSSIFIAASLWYVMKTRFAKKKEK